jgi:hypothetical protein
MPRSPLRRQSSLRASSARLTSRAQPGQLALDERQQLVYCLEVGGASAHDMLGASAERVRRSPRFAGELHDESVVRQEPAPLRSVRFQLMPSGGIRVNGTPVLPACC